ncbi:reverse transcriptase [Cooperia oncophora]
MPTNRDIPIQEEEMEQPLPYQPPEQQIFEEELLEPQLNRKHRQRLKHLRRTLSSEKDSDDQYEFNNTIISKLSSLQNVQECSTVISDVIQDLAVRNETLIIADSHPQVFQFLDSKIKSDSLKSMDPRLSEFMESIRKKEQEGSRKRKSSSPQPFRGKEAAWRPASFARRPPTSYWSRPYADRRPYSYAGRDIPPTRSTREFPRKIEESRPVTVAEEKATGPKNARKTTSEFLAGSIHCFHTEWLALEPSKLVSTTVLNGYSLPLYSIPSKPANSGNRKSALMHKDFVNKEITELLSTGAIQEVSIGACNSLHVHPLSVGQRLVLDLSHLNKFLHVPKIKLDDISSIINALPEGGFMATFDLKAGYHHVRIAQNHTDLLGFHWEDKYYKFLCLPFGLSSAPYIFTKLLRSFIKVWRAQGRGIAIYIDDGIIFERSRAACAETVSIIRSDLKRAGWFFAEDKCKWDPSQSCTWLGFNIDLSAMSISVAPERLAKAVHRLDVMRSLLKPSLYERLRWAGTLSSLHTVLNIVDKRNTRAVSREIAAAQAQDWPLSKAWPKLAKSTSSYATGQIGYDKVKDSTVSHIIDVDASDHSLAHTFRELPHYLLGESSTAQGTFCHTFCFGHLQRIIDRVLINTDSQSSVTIYNKGSLGLHLHQLAQNIWDLERHHGFQLLVRWIPRSDNEEADFASRQIDYDDWRIADRIFTAVTSKWGEPQYDMFANDRNTRCDIFFSRFHCPGSSGIDAFAHSEPWKNGFLWLVPPINMISKTLKWAKMHGSKGILGCPLWESQPFYPIIK